MRGCLKAGEKTACRESMAQQYKDGAKLGQTAQNWLKPERVGQILQPLTWVKDCTVITLPKKGTTCAAYPAP